MILHTSISEDLPLRLSCAFKHAATLHHLYIKSGPTFTYVNKDCAHLCPGQAVQRKNSYCFSSSILQSHNSKSPLLKSQFSGVLIFSHLRSASLSAFGYQLCSSCIPPVQDHLQIPHLPSGKRPCLGRTWTRRAKHLSSRPRR